MCKYLAKFLTALGLSLILLPCRSLAKNDNRIIVNNSFNKSEFILHEPIIATVSLKNESDSVLIVDLGQSSREYFGVFIETPDNETVFVNSLSPINGATGSGWKRLNSQETLSVDVLLNDYYNFNKTGTYKIYIFFSMPLLRGDVSLGQVNHGTMMVKIGSGSDEKLDEICNGIYNKIINENNAETKISLIRSLNSIKSPVATKYFIKYLDYSIAGDTHFYMYQSIVNGLIALDSRESSEALLLFYNSNRNSCKDDNSKMIIEYVYGRLLSYSNLVSDEKVKSKIKESTKERPCQ